MLELMPGDKPFDEQWAEQKREELELEDRKTKRSNWRWRICVK